MSEASSDITLVYLCTGNAARSVMATIFTNSSALADRSNGRAIIPIGAGTFVIEGLPMSHRVRNALQQLGHDDPGHRSHQLTARDVEAADVIVAFAPEHVAYVRRRYPEAAARTATLKRLVQELPSATDGALSDRLVGLQLDQVEVEDWEEVLDPAGGEQDEFHECAAEVDELIGRFLLLL